MSNRNVERVLVALHEIPHDDQVGDIQLNPFAPSVRFVWRGDRFKVEIDEQPPFARVYQEDGLALEGSNMALLMQHIIRSKVIEMALAEVATEVQS